MSCTDVESAANRKRILQARETHIKCAVALSLKSLR